MEALLVGEKFGLDPKNPHRRDQRVDRKEQHHRAQDPAAGLHGRLRLGFKAALMTKDVGIAAGLARAVGVETPYLPRSTLKIWRSALSRLPDGADHTEIVPLPEAA